MRSGIAIGEGLERAETRDDSQKEGKDSREDAGAAVFRSKFFFVISARETVKEFLARLIVQLRHIFVLASGQRDLRHLWDDTADAKAKASNGQILSFQQIIHPYAVSIAKGALEQIL